MFFFLSNLFAEILFAAPQRGHLTYLIRVVFNTFAIIMYAVPGIPGIPDKAFFAQFGNVPFHRPPGNSIARQSSSLAHSSGRLIAKGKLLVVRV